MNTLKFAELASQKSILIVGSNLNREVPLAAVRARKASLAGAQISVINPVDYDATFDITHRVIVSPMDIPVTLAKIILALVLDVTTLPIELQKILIGLSADSQSHDIARSLRESPAAIITGQLAENHPDASLIRSLLHVIAEKTGAKQLRLTTGANSAGASLAGFLPHRTLAGRRVESEGMNVQAALDAKLKGYFLLEAEPGFDFANPHRTRQTMLGAEFVVMLSAFDHPAMDDYANVILPIAPYAETSGTTLNVDSVWHTVQGALMPQGEARPAWKVIRVLANLLHCPSFDYTSTADILDEIKQAHSMATDILYSPYFPDELPVIKNQLVRVGEWPMYRIDAIVRHAKALQHCGSSEQACVRVHPITADRLKLNEMATVSQGDIEITLPLKRDERIAHDVIWVANAMTETVDLGHSFASITIKP